jgi:hypothetical protein
MQGVAMNNVEWTRDPRGEAMAWAAEAEIGQTYSESAVPIDRFTALDALRAQGLDVAVEWEDGKRYFTIVARSWPDMEGL